MLPHSVIRDSKWCLLASWGMRKVKQTNKKKQGEKEAS